MKYQGYNRLAHVIMARHDPEAAALTADQFDLWWRYLSDSEREEIYTSDMMKDQQNFMVDLYDSALSEQTKEDEE